MKKLGLKKETVKKLAVKTAVKAGALKNTILYCVNDK
jgi:hypothetical protein